MGASPPMWRASPEPVAAFGLDHNIAVGVVPELIARGHTATRMPLVHNAPDYEHLLYAAQQHWILLTHNAADFRLLHGAWHVWAAAWGLPSPPTHTGILIPPQGRWTDAALAEAVHQFVSTRPAL